MRIVFAAAVIFLLAASRATAESPASPINVGPFTFAVPTGWKTVTPSSPMRKAQLEIDQGSEKAEVTFFHFGAGQGGSAADNVTRWFAQFPGSDDKRKTETVEIGSVKITFATTEGTFNSGMPGGPSTPMTGYALCGAIMESANGIVFVKMTGSKAVVKISIEAFKKMISDAAKNAAPRA